MKKRVWPVTAALVLSLGLMGCASTEGAGETNASEPAESTSAESAPATASSSDGIETRTYTLENGLDVDVTEFYLYRADATERGENLTATPMKPGDTKEITVEGKMIGEPNETLWVLEYVAEDGSRGQHTTLHVEDQLVGQTIYILGADGISSATPFAFSDEQLPDQREAVEDEEVETSRIYTMENKLDETVAELYCYPSDDTDKGENLAGQGMKPGDKVLITVDGFMIGTPNETLWTIEYVTESGQTGKHTTLHVEDQLVANTIYIMGEDGISSATPFAFSDAQLNA